MRSGKASIIWLAYFLSGKHLQGLTVDPHPVIVTVRDRLGSSYVPMIPLLQGGGPPKQCQKNLKMLQVHAWFG